MNSTVRQLWGAAAAIAEERGLRVVKVRESDHGVEMLVRRSSDMDSTGPWVSFLFSWDIIEAGEFALAFREYREALARGFGDTPEEREAARLEAQRELGKQKTPFRPGRRRVRFGVHGQAKVQGRHPIPDVHRIAHERGPWSGT